MQLELGLPPSRGPALLLVSSPEIAWQGGIAPWFKAVAPRAWQGERHAAVVVPTRGHALALKERLLRAGQAALGLQFVTPPYLRELLWAGADAPLPPREHLRLLLALAAEENLADKADSEAEHLAAISVRRTPDHLLRLLDQLSAAGCDFEEVNLPAFRPLVRRFRAHLARAGFHTFAEADRAALTRAQQRPPLLSDLLVTGFHAAHWPLWHLLRAAVQAAEQSLIVLQNPRTETADLDAAWIGSWEEIFGEAKPAEIDDEADAPARATLFLAGMDACEQAEAIVVAAEQFLADEHCTRLGVVFPAPGALSRLVASLLTQQETPHYDAMGQMTPGIFEGADFWAWMELQRTPRSAALLRFLTTLPGEHSFFAQISRPEIADGLNKTLSDLALDDLAVLSAACRERGGKGELIATALGGVQFLPEHASFPEFLRATALAFEQLQWTERWQEIEKRAAWSANVRGKFSRTLFLKWLGEIGTSFSVTRDVLGQHPYARVQLLTPAQAEDQSWSHLILAGLNETAWPAAAGGDFLPAAQIDSLNQSVQKINRAATRRGRQGEGHLAVREGKTIFLGAAQQRQLALAQFAGLIESARHGLALTASVVQEATPERISNPSEFFSRAYHEVHARAPSQTTMRALRDATRRWLKESDLREPPARSHASAIEQTRIAYAARRDAGPSGEYDFALRAAPNEIMPLSVSDVEALLKSPALVWMRRFLGVQGEEDSTYAWNATAGKWTHDWLAHIASNREAFSAFPAPNEIKLQISNAAEQTRATVHRLCKIADKAVPDWWESGWENALSLAQTLGRILATAEGWKWIVPEWRLETQPIAVGQGESLLLRGRADLLLAKTPEPPASLAVPALWIIDFKTGSKESLAFKKQPTPEQRVKRVRKLVLKREALQLSLYALAARQLGARKVEVSLLSPLITRAEPQLHLDDFAECAAAFQELARMQATGIFGMHGSLRGAFDFARDYPLATLAIDGEVIDARWEATHPDLVLEEERW